MPISQIKKFLFFEKPKSSNLICYATNGKFLNSNPIMIRQNLVALGS